MRLTGVGMWFDISNTFGMRLNGQKMTINQTEWCDILVGIYSAFGVRLNGQDVIEKLMNNFTRIELTGVSVGQGEITQRQ